MKATVTLTAEEAAELIKAGLESSGKKVVSVYVSAKQELSGYGQNESYVPVPKITAEIEL